MDQEIELKLCKTCNVVKELSKYRPRARECKQCNNAKDAVNHLRRNKTYYEKHRERIIKHNINNYYKNKLLKEENNEGVVCA